MILPSRKPTWGTLLTTIKKMTHKLEQENQELKRQLQDAQRQNDVLNKRLFNFENCKSKDSNAAFLRAFKAGTL